MHSRNRFTLTLALLLVVVLSACDERPREFKTTLFAFGTLIDITLYTVNAEQAEAAFDRLAADFQRYHHDWSPWEDGALSHVNQQLRQGKPATLTPELTALVRQAIQLSKQSHGLFNPTIGNLINLWQFHLSDQADAKPPADNKIRELVLSHPQTADLLLNGQQLSSRNPAVQLSFGAFAKGYGIQLALNTLADMGIHNAVINAGGDLGVRGTHGKRLWRIGIRDPRSDGVLASVEAKDGENVFTSGDYERFYFYQGHRYHHILNPETGYPTTGFSSATVIHHHASVADAAATALMVAGPERWQVIAKALQLRFVLLVDEQGTIYMTPAMAKRIELQKPATNHIIVSETL